MSHSSNSGLPSLSHFEQSTTVPAQQSSSRSITQSQNVVVQADPISGVAQMTKLMRGSVAYTKILKNAEVSKAQTHKAREAKAYVEKEKVLFDQFKEFSQINTTLGKSSFNNSQQTPEYLDFKGFISLITEYNSKREAELRLLEEKYVRFAEDDDHELQSSMLLKSVFSHESSITSYPAQEQLVYVNSIQKMRKNLDQSIVTIKEDPKQIQSTIEHLIVNQRKIEDMIEVQDDITAQLHMKASEISQSIDKIQKQKNEIIAISELFEKKFVNLEIRELNALKKHEEAEVQTFTYSKELEETNLKGQMVLQEKQMEKADIYNEVKHLKHNLTVCLVAIDQKEEIKRKQEQEITALEDKERELLQTMHDSKHLVTYIDAIEALEKIFLQGNDEGEQIELLADSMNSQANQFSESQQQSVKNASIVKKKVENIGSSTKFENSTLNMRTDETANESNENGISLRKSNSKDSVDLPKNYVNQQPLSINKERSFLVERLQKFFDDHQNDDNVIEGAADHIIKELRQLKITSLSLHKRYQELIQSKQVREQELFQLNRDILVCQSNESIIQQLKSTQDKTEELGPSEEHETCSEWMRSNFLINILDPLSTNAKKKKIVRNSTIQEVGSSNDLEEGNDEEQEEQDNENERQLLKISQQANPNEEDKISIDGNLKDEREGALLFENRQTVDQEIIKQNASQNNELAQKKNPSYLNSVKIMEEYISGESRLQQNSLRVKSDELNRLGLKLFFNQLETLFRLAQIAQDISKKVKQVMPDKEFEDFATDLRSFVNSVRKGVSMKREDKQTNVNYIPYNIPQLIRKEDSKKFSFMEPLAQRFEKERSRNSSATFPPQAVQNEDGQPVTQQPTTPSQESQMQGYLPNSVIEFQDKKNKLENFLDLHNYYSLTEEEIISIFQNVLESKSTEHAVLFAQTIRKDIFLTLFESKESIIDYLMGIKEEFKHDLATAQIESLKRTYLLKEHSQKEHWAVLKNIFHHYLNFYSTIKNKSNQIWSSATVTFKKLFKPHADMKEENKNQSNYYTSVIDKLQQFKNENVALSEPITEVRMESQTDLEVVSKEKENSKNLRKIIYQLASNAASEQQQSQKRLLMKAKNNLSHSSTSQSSNRKNGILKKYSVPEKEEEGEEITLLDQHSKKELMLQRMSENDFLDFENKQVKAQKSRNEENEFVNGTKSPKSSFARSADFLGQRSAENIQHLRSFVENEKVIWKLRQLENRREKSDKKLQLIDYLPKNTKISEFQKISSWTFTPAGNKRSVSKEGPRSSIESEASMFNAKESYRSPKMIGEKQYEIKQMYLPSIKKPKNSMLSQTVLSPLSSKNIFSSQVLRSEESLYEESGKKTRLVSTLGSSMSMTQSSVGFGRSSLDHLTPFKPVKGYDKMRATEKFGQKFFSNSINSHPKIGERDQKFETDRGNSEQQGKMQQQQQQLTPISDQKQNLQRLKQAQQIESFSKIYLNKK